MNIFFTVNHKYKQLRKSYYYDSQTEYRLRVQLREKRYHLFIHGRIHVALEPNEKFAI